MQKPLVSVIVPIYNAQNNIVRCVESIRRQTYENLEILLLNDGSKDVSYPVCDPEALVAAGHTALVASAGGRLVAPLGFTPGRALIVAVTPPDGAYTTKRSRPDGRSRVEVQE